MVKKSITTKNSKISHAFVIKEINMNKITIDKFDVDCRKDIEESWGNISYPEEEKKMEVVLRERIAIITLEGRPDAIETAVNNAGQVIKDVIFDKTPKGKKVYISNIELFQEYDNQ